MTDALATPRLTLRPLTADDLDGFAAVWCDPEVIFWGAAKDREAARGMLERVIARGAGAPWPVRWHAVVERASGALVGDVLLQEAPYAPGELEAGWHLRRTAWGKGYATEAAGALLAEAFARLEVARLTCVILPQNLRSQRVAARLGFARVGPVTHAGLLHDLLALCRVDGRGQAPSVNSGRRGSRPAPRPAPRRPRRR